MKQLSVKAYYQQFDETRFFFLTRSVKPVHLDVINFIADLQHLAKLGKATDC